MTRFRVISTLGMLVVLASLVLGMVKQHLAYEWWKASGTSLLLLSIVLLQLLTLAVLVNLPRLFRSTRRDQ